MKPTQPESVEHARFDELCAEVGDFEPLPTVTTERPETLPITEGDDQDSVLDGQILAGLVSP
jgi:hypothetical protein